MNQAQLRVGVMLLSFVSFSVSAQPRAGGMEYDPSPANPFGLPNPAAPQQIAQFAFIIGKSDCTEERLNNATGEWQSSARTWDGHYIMNGFGIFDSGKSASSANSNIRVYDESRGQWQVTFFAMPSYSSSVWKGGLESENMVLKQPQQAPGTSLDGFSTLTFSNISNQGFEWSGEWISEDGSIVFPFWRVSCKKRAS